MKNYNLIILASVTFILASSSCKKADYLTDEGLHDAKSSLSTYEYLRQHSWHSFDTLITIIDHYNMKDEINSAGTFFASTNATVKRYMDLRLAQKKLTNDSAKYSLDSLYKDISADSLRQYLFKEKITLSNAPNIQPAPYTSLGKTSSAVFKQLQSTSTYTQYTTGQTYLLYLVKVRGQLDVPGITPPANEIDINVQCQTTGIEPATGGILHVLTNQHVFVRF